MKQYVIKRIPNSENGERARKILKLYDEFTYKTHGRGHRFGGGAGAAWHKSRFGHGGVGGWNQELPLEYAAWWTLYPKGGYRQPGYWEKQYFEFKGWKGDKPILRQCAS
jgi:hypothetical protein